jgi:glycosyltransferase involved in cell wall biosynthesis
LKSILFIQPFISEYRRVFFSFLRVACQNIDIELTIFAPKPDQDFSLRNDSISGLTFIHEIGVSRFKMLNRQMDYYRYPVNVRIKDFDLVIMEQTIKNIQYPLALLRRLPKTKVALWGHGRTVVKEKSRFEQWLQLVLSKHADFIFAYTSTGRDYLVDNGYPENRIVALQNTNSSIARLDRIKKYESESNPNNKDFHCCFIGAMEISKGLEVLIQALPIIKESLPDFQFTFIGDGSEGKKVSELALSSDYIQFLGFKNQEEIDKISNQFSLILNPGRIGLIAVDSLMLKLPIVTLRDSYHAPEYEYIKGNSASVSVSGSVKDYANAVINLLNSKEDLQKMRYVCAEVREHYTFEIMVRNFKNGILKVLNQET